MAWARENRYIVFTNDLDYGALLFATAAASPSVIQIRVEDIRPASAEHAVLFALKAAAEDLSTGALVTIDPRRQRIVAAVEKLSDEPFPYGFQKLTGAAPLLEHRGACQQIKRRKIPAKEEAFHRRNT